MKKNSKLLSALLAGSLVISFSVAAFADPANPDQKTSKVFSKIIKMGNGDNFRMGGFNCNQLVEEGIISQEQADKIAAFQETQQETRKAEMEKIKAMTEEEREAYFKNNQKNNPVEDLVKAGLITQEQADQISQAMPTNLRMIKMEPGLSPDLAASLVEKGLISQEQGDKIKTFLAEKMEAKQAEMEKIKDMTDEERQTYFEKNKDKVKINLMDELVAAKLITQEQADQISKEMPTKLKMFKMESGFPQAASLVEKGIISQDQADKIKALLDEKMEAGKAEMEKIKNMTAEERKTYFENNKDKVKVKINLMDELVEAKIITQEQADQISQLMPKHENKMFKIDQEDKASAPNQTQSN